MMKSIGLLVIGILIVDVVVITVSFMQQSSKLTEAGANVSVLESEVSILNGELLTLRGTVSVLQSRLAATEEKASNLQGRLIQSEAKSEYLQLALMQIDIGLAAIKSDVNAQQAIDFATNVTGKVIKLSNGTVMVDDQWHS